MDQKKKIQLVSNEIKRLNSIFKDVESKKKRTVKGLIEEAAFMKVTLIELKDLVNEHGAIDDMPQGDYSILREHPALKSYNTTIQRYTTVTEKLLNLLPKDEKPPDDGLSEFSSFLNERAD